MTTSAPAGSSVSSRRDRLAHTCRARFIRRRRWSRPRRRRRTDAVGARPQRSCATAAPRALSSRGSGSRYRSWPRISPAVRAALLTRGAAGGRGRVELGDAGRRGACAVRQRDSISPIPTRSAKQVCGELIPASAADDSISFHVNSSAAEACRRLLAAEPCRVRLGGLRSTRSTCSSRVKQRCANRRSSALRSVALDPSVPTRTPSPIG